MTEASGAEISFSCRYVNPISLQVAIMLIGLVGGELIWSSSGRAGSLVGVVTTDDRGIVERFVGVGRDVSVLMLNLTGPCDWCMVWR